MIYDFSKFDVGQGIISSFDSVDDDASYLITNVADNGIDVVSVRRIDFPEVMCTVSHRSVDKDNVPLVSCPPPFSNIGSSGVYAIADVNNASHIKFSEFERYNVRTSDDYAKISEKDLRFVFDHNMKQEDKEFTFTESHNYSERELPYIDAGDNFTDENYFDF
jgi:hypothetical protein